MNYVEKYFLGEVVTRKKRKNPLFKLFLWNKHEQMLQQAVTTNNGDEGWNANWNGTSSRRDNYWKVLSHLQVENGICKTRWRELASGVYSDPNPGRTRKLVFKMTSI